MILAVIDNVYGVVYTARRITAFCTAWAFEGVLADHTAVLALCVIPVVITYVTAYGTYSVNSSTFVHTVKVAFQTVMSVPFVLAGETTGAALAVRPPIVIAFLTAHGAGASYE